MSPDAADSIWATVGTGKPLQGGFANGTITPVSVSDKKLVVTNDNSVAQTLNFIRSFAQLIRCLIGLSTNLILFRLHARDARIDFSGSELRQLALEAFALRGQPHELMFQLLDTRALDLRLLARGADGFFADISRRSHAEIDEWQTQMQLKPMRIAPCGISGCCIRYSAAAMISATPALLSAPSNTFLSNSCGSVKPRLTDRE